MFFYWEKTEFISNFFLNHDRKHFDTDQLVNKMEGRGKGTKLAQKT